MTTKYTLQEAKGLIKPRPVSYASAVRLLYTNKFPNAKKNKLGYWEIPQKDIDALNDRRMQSPHMHSKAWTFHEIRILENAYPLGGYKKTHEELKKAGFERSRGAIEKQRERTRRRRSK